jgi:hypothetical protein
MSSEATVGATRGIGLIWAGGGDFSSLVGVRDLTGVLDDFVLRPAYPQIDRIFCVIYITFFGCGNYDGFLADSRLR